MIECSAKEVNMKKFFDKPKLVGLIGDVNSAKSNTLYHIIETLKKDATFNLHTYGLKFPQGHEIFSIDELEQIENSIIIIDEVFNLFNLGNAKDKRQIENTLRLIHHRNNVLILSLLPENSKKFLASKIDTFIFKKCSIADCINGSMTKRIINQYCGPEKGTTTLNIPIDKALFFNGKSFNMIDVDYYPEFDSKAGNKPILRERKKSLFKKTC